MNIERLSSGALVAVVLLSACVDEPVAPVAGASAIAKDLAGPRGPKPRAAFSRRNIILYGTLIMVALYYRCRST